jgi:transposase
LQQARAYGRVLNIEIERLKLLLAKLRHEQYGQSSERAKRLLEQLELQLEDLEETTSADEAAAEISEQQKSSETTEVRGFQRRKPARRPLPDHLPRTRIVHPAPTACPCCGGGLRKLGEHVLETLERIPARWFVIQNVREKFSCRACEAITEPPAPSYPISRGRAGPNLLADVAFGKFGMHLPLHRQSERFACEGVDLDVSTLCDWVGAICVALMPLVEAIIAHVLSGQRIHTDDTPVKVLAKGKCRTGRRLAKSQRSFREPSGDDFRLWTVVRDDRPFAGSDPPAAFYFYSSDRSGAYSGFGALYKKSDRIQNGRKALN